MAEESLSELVEKLATFREQLEQIEGLLAGDPTNEALIKLKEDLLVVINLTTDLVNIKKAEEEGTQDKHDAGAKAPPPPPRQREKERSDEEERVGERAAPPEDTSLLEDLELYSVGSIYETKFEGSWFPVYIESATSDGQYNVIFLGYRNTATVPSNDLREIKAPERTLDPIEVVEGMECVAKYAVDGKYYPGVIKRQTEYGFIVKFTEYGNEDEVPAEYLAPKSAAVALSAPKPVATAPVKPVKPFEIPENLKPLPTDTEEERERKRKKIKAIKKRHREMALDSESKAKQSSWQNFATSKKKAKSGFVSTMKREKSIFASPEGVEGKVGVINSGKGMTQFDDTRKRYVLK